MKVKLFILYIFIVCSCSRNREEIAPEKTYFFEVNCGSENPQCRALKEFIEESIPQFKYTITNKSGQTWPYYEAFEKDFDVPSNSLMPPHWQIQRMELRKEGKKIYEGQVLVQIDICNISDTYPDFNVTINKMKGPKLSVVATSGVHYADSTRVNETQSLQDIILKSIIRYTFK